MTKTVTIEINEEDYFNIMGWWTAVTMMVEGGMRTSVRDSERTTIEKVSKAKRELEMRK